MQRVVFRVLLIMTNLMLLTVLSVVGCSEDPHQ